MTDFGTANDAVALCKAVMLNIAPDARIMDITHQVTPFHIEEGARNLESVSPYYPAGTVFVAVIDPGVGTSRKAIIVKTKKGQYFVVPDNGLITPVTDRDGLDSAREITNPSWMIQAAISSTFHGRDIFSPAGAHLAAGWDFNMVGPVVPELVRLTLKTSTTTDKGIDGDIIALDDPFGSLVTDIPGDQFKKLGYALGDKFRVEINKKPVTLPYAKTFMDVPVGERCSIKTPVAASDLPSIRGISLKCTKLRLPLPCSSPRRKCPPRASDEPARQQFGAPLHAMQPFVAMSPPLRKWVAPALCRLQEVSIRRETLNCTGRSPVHGVISQRWLSANKGHRS